MALMLALWFPGSEAQRAEGVEVFQNAPNPVRRICDPHTGTQWVLERDPSNLGGPGRMVPDNNASCHRITVKAEHHAASREASGRRQQAMIVSAPIVIHAGDVVVLEENTPQLETRLEAVALSSAAEGAEFTARLTFQGAIVRAVALAPDRATLGRALRLPRRPW